MSLWKLSKSSRVRDPFSTEINKFGLRMLPPARKGTLLVSIRRIKAQFLSQSILVELV